MKDYSKMYEELFNEKIVNDESETIENLKEQLKKAFEVKSQICKNINITFVFDNNYNEELFTPYISIKKKEKEIIIFLQDLDEDIIFKLSLLIKNIKKEHKNDILDLGTVFTFFYNIFKNTEFVTSFNF